MDEVTQFLVQHGALVLFVAVFAEQIGLPIPAIPVLLAAGALAGTGRMDLGAAVVLTVVACTLGDLIWYVLGRYKGRHVLGLLCRISLEPDSCVRQTESFFLRHGSWSLVLAKFIPGVSTVTPALAGLFAVTIRRFLLFNGLGAFLWAMAFIVPGYLFSSQLAELSARVARYGSSLGILVGGILALYIAYKFIHRYLLLRKLRIARITPDELKQLLDGGEAPVIVDLRQPLDVEADPWTIPGAIRMAVEELTDRHHEIPRDRDVILYCACPNEVTAARMALMLKRNGITRVRPLAGGVVAWREREYPLEALAARTV